MTHTTADAGRTAANQIATEVQTRGGDWTAFDLGRWDRTRGAPSYRFPWRDDNRAEYMRGYNHALAAAEGAK